MKHLESYIRSVRPQFEDMLAQAVEIPSVSSEPGRKKEIARMAAVAAQYLRSLGARRGSSRPMAIPWCRAAGRPGSRIPR